MCKWLRDFNFETKDLPNCVNLNLYEHGGHSVGWHADDEDLFGGKTHDTRIISVSLGAPRQFCVAPRGTQQQNTQTCSVSDVKLCHGDLCTMEGLFQKHFLHQLVRNRSRVHAPRVNATFRWIVKHSNPCPLHLPCNSERELGHAPDSKNEKVFNKTLAHCRIRMRGRSLDRYILARSGS